MNAESMLEKCFIGPLQRSNVVKKTKPSRTGTCHMSQLRVADFLEDTVWYSNMSRSKAWQYQILQAITIIVKQTLWRITDKISGLKGWKSLWHHFLQYILLNHGLLVWSSYKDQLYFKERITALQEVTCTFCIQ